MPTNDHDKLSPDIFKQFFERVYQGLRTIGGLLILMFLLGVIIDVTFRIGRRTIDWMQEITTFIFVWSSFLGAPVVFRKGTLYIIDIIPKNIPLIIERVLRLFVLLLIGVFIWVFIRYGVRLSVMGINRISQPSGVRIVYAFSAIPISGFFFAVFFIEAIVDWFRLVIRRPS